MIKSLVTGGAGFIVTNKKALAEKMKASDLIANKLSQHTDYVFSGQAGIYNSYNGQFK